MSAHTPLGDGREFATITALLDVWGERARGIGDDAAVLDVPAGQRLVVSTDTSVDAVHFRRDWLSADEIGWRVTMAALSDLAAMGAQPLGVVLAITCPPDERDRLPEYARGIGDAVAHAGTVIVGGDLSRGATLSFGVTVFGAAPTPLLRRGARVGDALWVSGALGGPGVALDAWQRGAVPPAAARARFARPEARLALGTLLAEYGATAAIDISDGLLADASHIAAASGVALTIALEQIPCLPDCAAEQGVTSGEEYELLFTAPPTFDAATVMARTGLPVTRIGTVEGGPAAVRATRAGVRVEIAGGYDHFST